MLRLLRDRYGSKCIATAVLGLACWLVPAPASAQLDPGLRAGVSVDPDQFYVGAHVETAPIVERLVFRPNVEVGFGDDVIVKFDSRDVIQFDDELFASPGAALAAALQVGNDVVIAAGTDSVTLLGVKLTSLQLNDFSIVV